MFFLGISAYYHDSSVALIDSTGNLVDFKKEEWLSRVKGDKSFPRLALQELINSYNLSELEFRHIISENMLTNASEQQFLANRCQK